MKKKAVEKEVVKEILKSCSLYERIVAKIFYKEFEKMYNVIRIELMNIYLN